MMEITSLAQLRAECAKRKMPLEKMRFFLGEDRREARCFGIYQEPDSGDWVVYKNKADGSRAVRYRGPDEAYACQLIWDKMGAEVQLRVTKKEKAKLQKRQSRESSVWTGIAVGIAALALALSLARSSERFRQGYYQVDDDLYFFQSGEWYGWADDGGWYYYEDFDAQDISDHYYGESYSFEDGGDSFYSSSYYDRDAYYEYENQDDDDWDSDWGDDDWDSWDSGDTDWDSDW